MAYKNKCSIGRMNLDDVTSSSMLEESNLAGLSMLIDKQERSDKRNKMRSFQNLAISIKQLPYF